MNYGIKIKKMKIDDQTNGKLQEIIKFADENKLSDELMKALSRFYRFLANGQSVVLAPDYA